MAFSLSVPEKFQAQWKEKCSLTWTCLLQICLDWFLLHLWWFSLDQLRKISDIWLLLLQFTRSISSVRNRLTLHYIHYTAIVRYIWPMERPACKATAKKKSESTRHWFDDSYMFIIIRNELVYYLSPVLSSPPRPIQSIPPLIIQPPQPWIPRPIYLSKPWPSEINRNPPKKIKEKSKRIP